MAPPSSSRPATIVPGMQQSNYVSQVTPPVRVKPAQLAPMASYMDNIPSNPATPSPTTSTANANAYDPSKYDDYLYGSGKRSDNNYLNY